MNRSVGCGQAARPFCTAYHFSCKSLPRASRSLQIRRPDSYSLRRETYAHGEKARRPAGRMRLIRSNDKMTESS